MGEGQGVIHPMLGEVSEASRRNHPLEAQLCRWNPYNPPLWDSKFLGSCSGERWFSPLLPMVAVFLTLCSSSPSDEWNSRRFAFAQYKIAPNMLPLSRLMQDTRAIWMCHDINNKHCWFGKERYTSWNSAEGASEKSCSKTIVHWDEVEEEGKFY